MTAGQNGPDQQGWQQPPPYGYAPAPSAPPAGGGPAVEPKERPTTVRVGVGAFLATLILGLIASVVQLTDSDDLVDQIRDADPSISEDTAQAAFTVAIVIGLIVVALQALFIWFAWNGRNWARIVLFVLGGLGIVSGLAGLTGTGATNVSGFLTSLSVFSLVLTVVGVVALALKPSSDWYRHEGWRRSVTR